MSLPWPSNVTRNRKAAAQLLRSWGMDYNATTLRQLRSLGAWSASLPQFDELARILAEQLPGLRARENFLSNLERLFSQSPAPDAVVDALCELAQTPTTASGVFEVIAVGTALLKPLDQALRLRQPIVWERRSSRRDLGEYRDDLTQRLQTLLRDAFNDDAVARRLMEFKNQEWLQVAVNQVLGNATPEQSMQQLSLLAEVIIQATVDAGQRLIAQGRALPAGREHGRFVVMATGKLGGSEVSFNDNIDLIFLYAPAANVDRPLTESAADYFQHLTRLILRLLNHPNGRGTLYRVNHVLALPGAISSPAIPVHAAAAHYQSSGRTWDRLTLIQLRSIAGDKELGDGFYRNLAPWIYRRFLNRADITGIRQLKRRIEHRSSHWGQREDDIRSGCGGIDDIVLAIEFLQLLNGGDLDTIRCGNTFEAIDALEHVGCLTPQEASVLKSNYLYLATLEHWIQIVWGIDAHRIPRHTGQREFFARLIPPSASSTDDPVQSFDKKLAEVQSINRRVLDHLLHDAFGDDEQVPIETELVLDPDPSAERIDETLGQYGFVDARRAHQLLLELAVEKIPFLSTRRCRHFLAAIAPRLLESVAQTPDPEATLENLVRLSDSLGGKSALWELASFAPATLDLVVRLPAVGAYLCGILTANPGMIDELMDSLVLNRLPSRNELESLADEMCHGADNVMRILFSFRNSVHLRVGVRDILGLDDIASAHRVLSDCADICVAKIAQQQYESMVQKFGQPHSHQGQPVELVILAGGKLGGQEPNYHSNLDLMFLYESEGHTEAQSRGRQQRTTNNHFFNQLGQRIIQAANAISPQGRLYHVDTYLRPSGGSSILAVPYAQLHRYFESDSAKLGEVLSLCKTRPIFGSTPARQSAREHVQHVIQQVAVSDQTQHELRSLRHSLQREALPTNLKRGPGGTLDVELLVQMNQVAHAAQKPQVLVPGTLEGIEALRASGVFSDQAASELRDAYAYLRRVESGLRLLNTAARHDLPADTESLRKLAYLLRLDNHEQLLQECKQAQLSNRKWFDELTQ